MKTDENVSSWNGELAREDQEARQPGLLAEHVVGADSGVARVWSDVDSDAARAALGEEGEG